MMESPSKFEFGFAMFFINIVSNFKRYGSHARLKES